MEVLCIESEAFYTLIDTVVARIKASEGNTDDKWINDTEAMRLLGIKSKTTLQSLRDKGEIRFSQPMKKVILYDRVSINDYLEKYVKNTF